MVKRLVVGGLSALALWLVPTAWAGGTHPAASAEIRPFTVYGVSTREQRSDLVAQGFDIGEAAWADHVMLYGSKAQALALSAYGYHVLPHAPDDFPPYDSGYHNYAEMVADVQNFAAAYPGLAHVFSLGRRTRAVT